MKDGKHKQKKTETTKEAGHNVNSNEAAEQPRLKDGGDSPTPVSSTSEESVPTNQKQGEDSRLDTEERDDNGSSLVSEDSDLDNDDDHIDSDIEVV